MSSNQAPPARFFRRPRPYASREEECSQPSAAAVACGACQCSGPKPAEPCEHRPQHLASDLSSDLVLVLAPPVRFLRRLRCEPRVNAAAAALEMEGGQKPAESCEHQPQLPSPPCRLSRAHYNRLVGATMNEGHACISRDDLAESALPITVEGLWLIGPLFTSPNH